MEGRKISLDSIKLNLKKENQIADGISGKDVAIIGIAVRFPHADSLESYWENIRNGIDCITDLPDARKNDAQRYLKLKYPESEGFNFLKGAYLEDIDQFDCDLFQLTPKEAALMNPAHRLFLETAWSAIEDAGYGGKKLSNSNTGVYIGVIGDLEGYKYKEMIFDTDPYLLPISVSGNLGSMIPGRIAHILNLKGPGMLVDTACSSSLVAVDLACKAIRNGSCGMALAGGAKLNLLPLDMACFKIGIESSDNATRAFDEQSDGSGMGEGVGVVLLKSLSKALIDRDNIYAVIKGSAVNHDGTSAGITAPNPDSQANVLIKAWEDAGIDPGTVSYIETHGTGTRLGDTIEIDGLNSAFSRYTDKKQFCAIGSVKTNLGHLYESAGIAGLIKTVLALKYAEMPPSIYFKRPNRFIDFSHSPVYVNTGLRKWDRGKYPRRCGVSSFGISGTNCHVVVEEVPGFNNSDIDVIDNNCRHVFVLSAKTGDGMNKLIGNYIKHFNSRKCNLGDVCYTASTGRGHYSHRLAIVAESIEDLKMKLEKVMNNGLKSHEICGYYYGRHKVLSGEAEGTGKYGEITVEEHRRLTVYVNEKIGQYFDPGKIRYDLLDEICRLYVEGAEADWNRIYENGRYEKMSLPVYPFDRKRCWLDIPERLEVNRLLPGRHMYHSVIWKKAELERPVSEDMDGTVLILKNLKYEACSERVISALKSLGRDIVEVIVGERFSCIGPGCYTADGSEGDYQRLFDTIQQKKVSQIVHMLTLAETVRIDKLEQLENSLDKGVYSLFRLIKAAVQSKVRNNMDIFLISPYVNEVTGEEEIHAENAPLFGLGKVVGQEYSHIKCRCLDIDPFTGIENIVQELVCKSGDGVVAYRRNERYVEEFCDTDVESLQDCSIEIKSRGVYIITGGAGGIGLETAKWLAAQNKVNVALFNRSKMPDSSTWINILEENTDRKMCGRIQAAKHIESLGSRVVFKSVDISDLAQVSTALGELRQEYGKINGIIHAAAIAGNGFMIRKTEETFSLVLKPKIHGAWIMDRLTVEDKPDFFVMFSSALSVLGVAGQGDYAAANSYMDSFAALRSRYGGKTLTINWAAWKETGMAADYGANNDTVFKAIDTSSGISSFDKVINKKIKRVIVGEMNYNCDNIPFLRQVPIKLSDDIKRQLDRTGLDTGRNPDNKTPVKEITLLGKDSGDYSTIERQLAQICRNVLGFSEINVHDSFFELGADSILLKRVHVEVEKQFPGIVTIIDIFEYPSICKLARYIAGKSREFEKTDKRGSFVERGILKKGDIAVIGIAVKLPHSESIREFWENIKNGVNCIREFPDSRREDVKNFLDYKKSDRESITYYDGAYLDEIDKFDYKFFRYSPKEASLISPEQRLFLETAFGAIEDAGYGGEQMAGSNTGVFVGYYGSPRDNYQMIIKEVEPEAISISITGNTPAVMPGRLSYILDLKGPSMVVDTACSSSLVAVHLACRAIRNGDCEMAVAGGVKINTLPVYNPDELIGIESSDGQTRSFDDSADGSGIGEGVAAVILKPLEKAIADGDNIYAVIKGSASNQDGRCIGITAPNPAAQTEVILKAWEEAGIPPETISYIETHGTATELGDPVEIRGLRNAFEKFTDKKQFCAVGSVKTNLGHLFEGAGIVNLIKAVLALKNKQLPANLNFNKPNRNINFEESPMYVNSTLRSWETKSYPRRCGVSAFGFSGTNCHIVLEEAPKLDNGNFRSKAPQIFSISARSREALYALAGSYKVFFGMEVSGELRNICYTANTGRGHYNFRVAFIAKDFEDFKEKLEKFETLKPEKSCEWAFIGFDIKISGNCNVERNNEEMDGGGSELNQSAGRLLKEFVLSDGKDEGIMRELCRLYVQGADIDWQLIYSGEGIKKVSLPSYSFDRSRCWIDIPICRETETGGLYYKMSWKEQDISPCNIDCCVDEPEKQVLIFADKTGVSGEIARRLKREGRKIIFVSIGDEYCRDGEDSYVIRNIENDYIRLFQDIKHRNLFRVFHCLTLDGNKTLSNLEDLETNLGSGVYSLYCMIRAILGSGISDNLDIYLISNLANEVTGEEAFIKPCGAAIFGLGKVAALEYDNIRIRCIDIDGENYMDNIIRESSIWDGNYQIAYRNGKRYVQEFGEIDIGSFPQRKAEIKEDGVYLITGGTGGIGLEMAKSIAAKNRVKLILVSRSGMPGRETWGYYLSRPDKSKTYKKIRYISDMEASGSEVLVRNADAANFEQMEVVVNEIRAKYGKIDGIIHAAGIPGNGFVVRKDEESFNRVLRPKIYGAWILDKLTEAEELDFFVMFSGGSSILGEPGQGDYVAANSYLDVFSSFREKQGRKSLTVSWTAWKSAGMSVDYGFNTDMVFKAIGTEQAVNAFYKVLGRDIRHVLIGELNVGSRFVGELGEISTFELSPKVKAILKKSRQETIYSDCYNEGKTKGHRTHEVRLAGKEDEKYTEIEMKTARIYSQVLGYRKININDSFFELGGDSILLNRVHVLLEKEFPGKVRITDLFTYTSVLKLAQYIAGQSGESKPVKEPKTIQHAEEEADDIAIIGMAAIMPMADDISQYWDIIKNGIECVRNFPGQRRKDIEEYIKYTGLFNGEEVEYCDGAFIEDIDKFDYPFFRMSPKEASLTDPCQRLFLKTVWHAMEDAGYGGRKLSGSNTGVFLGYAAGVKDSYHKMIFDVDRYSLPIAAVGNVTAMMPSRISYLLDLKGPTMVIDTACSTTLVAVHTACRAIKNGDCKMAIAGGVRINLFPLNKEYLKVGIESESFKTRTFDVSADGSGVGEGAGAVLLKPLKRALEDRDNIYAVIKGSAINQDGASMSITAPNPEAQTEVILKAWEDAGIGPETISYIEAHGTATKLGDSIEIQGLTGAFRQFTDKVQFCPIGTVKTNIGHLYESAGIAGLIKTAMALKHKMIPPTVNFDVPNSKIDFEKSPVYINTGLREWEVTNYPRRCGVSCFGLSGTNCHMILEEAPELEKIKNVEGLKVLTMSAKSAASLRALVESYREFINRCEEDRIGDICFTSGTGRGHYNFRLAVIARNMDELREKLSQVDCDSLNNCDKVFYGEQKLNSDISYKDGKSETVQMELRGINSEAALKLDEFTGSDRKSGELLSEVCRYYVKGADVEWEKLYSDRHYRRISLPLYPFEPIRCWIDIPDADSRSSKSGDTGMYYTLEWVRDKGTNRKEACREGAAVVFKDTKGIGKSIAENLRTSGREVLEIEFGDAYRRTDTFCYTIKGIEEDYIKLFNELGDRKISRVIHLSTIQDIKDIKDISELEQSQTKGFYSVFYLIRAMAAVVDSEVDIVLVSEQVNEVTGKEPVLCPQNAPLFGMGRAIKKEHSNLECRCLDIDEYISVDEILKEINLNPECYQVALRNGNRYVEEFKEVGIEPGSNSMKGIKDGGVYIITGGTGGIGLETAKYLASQNKVKLALLNRSAMPDRELWQDILKKEEDLKTCRKIRDILEIESAGSEVICVSSDVAEMDQMEKVVGGIRKRFGKINGVIHGAGIGGAELIAKKSREDVERVIKPKIYGTWVLDRLTKEDSLDFFIMFSSIATIFSAPGQGDYIAANSFMDNYAASRKRNGGKTITINWPTWLETGMSVDHNFKIDTLFKAIGVKQAMEGFDRVLNGNVSRVLIGNINYESKIINLLKNYSYRLSDKIQKELEKHTLKAKTKVTDCKTLQSQAVRLAGRENGEYLETEGVIAQICRDTLGFEEINIHDNFFELGADSILLTRIFNQLDKLYPGLIEITDMFEFPTISKLSGHIENLTDKDQEQKENNYNGNKEEDDEDELVQMISEMEKGNLTVDQLAYKIATK